MTAELGCIDTEAAVTNDSGLAEINVYSSCHDSAYGCPLVMAMMIVDSTDAGCGLTCAIVECDLVKSLRGDADTVSERIGTPIDGVKVVTYS